MNDKDMSDFTTHDLEGQKILVESKKSGERFVGEFLRYFDQNGAIALKDYRVLSKKEDGKYTTKRRGEVIVLNRSCYLWIEKPPEVFFKEYY